VLNGATEPGQRDLCCIFSYVRLADSCFGVDSKGSVPTQHAVHC